MMFVRRLRLALTLVVALGSVLPACSRTDVFAVGPADVKLSVNPANAVVELGGAVQLHAAPTPNDAGIQIAWSVEPAGAGTVSASGLYKAPAAFPEAEQQSLRALVRASIAGRPEVFAEAQVTVVPRQVGPAAQLEKVSGDAQQGPVNEPVPQPFVVRAVNAQGQAVPGVVVHFDLVGATQPTTELVTDDKGLAQASPALDTTAGPQVFRASSDGLAPVDFTVTALAGPLEKLTATHPDPRGIPGAILDQPLVVSFHDAWGNPIAGLSAQVTDPMGSLVPPLAETSDARGEQPFRIALTPQSGVQTFRVVEPVSGLETSIDFRTLGQPAQRLVIVEGDAQQAAAATAFATRLKVQLLDGTGAPALPAKITWTAPDGGQLQDAQATSDEQGFASALFTAPTKAGLARVLVDAGPLEGSPATFTLRVVAGPAQRLQLVAGDGQVTSVGQLFGGAFSVRATDAFSNGVANVPVQFSAVQGGGSVQPASVTTGNDGLAQTQLTAGPQAGAQRFRAASEGLVGSPIDLTLSAVALPAQYRLDVVSGGGQSGAVKTDLAQPFVVRVTSGGQPASGQTVTFAAVVGDGTLRPTQSTTASDGLAVSVARLGSQVGTQRFSASLPGAVNSPVFFDVTTTSSGAALLRIVSGNGQVAAPGTTLPQPFVVEALDEAGQLLPGAPVDFLALGGGSVLPPSVQTDAQGRASAVATLGPQTGEQLFEARSGAALPVTFRATAQGAATGKRIRASAGSNQTNEVGLDLAQPLQVQVTNDAGQPLSGIEITWRAEAEAALVTPITSTTDAQGFATTSARLGKPVGTQRFFAECTGCAGGPVTFTETARAAPASRLVVASGDGQTALVRTALPKPLVARVTDRMGNPISGVTVTFRTGPAGGSITPASGVSDAQGEVAANATLGAAVGPQTFFAESAGLAGSPLPFTALATNAVDRISLSPQGFQVEVGASPRFVAVAIFSDQTSSVITEDATWTTSAPAVATVSDATGSKGIAQALGAGQVTLSASYGGKTGTTTLTVVQATLRSLNVLPAEATVVKGSTRSFRVLGTYSNNTVNDLTEAATWTSSSQAIATVSSTPGTKGLVRGVGVGVATITASAFNLTGSREVTISQAPLRQLEITPLDVAQPAGSAANFRATATYDDGTVEDVTAQASWSSSDTALMTVQNAPAQAGRATFLAAGSPNVVATYGGRTVQLKVTITAAQVLSLALTPRQVNLAVRDFMQLRLIATYTDGTVSEATGLATWSTSNASVADVSNAPADRGTVTALAQGGATITATFGGKTATSAVTVTGWQVQGIAIFGAGGRNAFSCPAGTLLQLRAGALYAGGGGGQPADITDQVSWITSDPTVAVVGQGAVQGGVVQCLKQGTVTITAAWSGKSATQQVTVTAAVLSRIEVAPTTAQLARGDTRSFFATGLYSDGTRRELTGLVTWTSGNEQLATVSNAPQTRGIVTGVAAGTVQITASMDGVSASATVTVTNAQLIAVVIAPANPVVRMRDRAVDLTATALYDDGSTQNVTAQALWTTSDPNVALVGNDAQAAGRLVLQGVGTCQVLATYGGKTGRTQLTVRN